MSLDGHPHHQCSSSDPTLATTLPHFPSLLAATATGSFPAGALSASQQPPNLSVGPCYVSYKVIVYGMWRGARFILKAVRVRFDQRDLPQVLRMVVHDKCFFPIRSNEFLIDGQAATDFVSRQVSIWVLQPHADLANIEMTLSVRRFYNTVSHNYVLQYPLHPNQPHSLCGHCTAPVALQNNGWLNRLFFPECRPFALLGSTPHLNAIPQSHYDYISKILFGNRKVPRMDRFQILRKMALTWCQWRDDEFPHGRPALTTWFYIMLLHWVMGDWKAARTVIRGLNYCLPQMDVSLKRVFRPCATRILYNLGHFDDALPFCLANPQDPMETQIDCFLEMALVYAHKNDARKAREALDRAIHLFDFSGDPNAGGLSQPFYVTYQQQFNRLMLYSLLCYAFLGEESFLFIAPPASKPRQFDVLKHVEQIVNAPIPINGPSFVAWGFEAQARAVLRHIENMLRNVAAISTGDFR